MRDSHSTGVVLGHHTGSGTVNPHQRLAAGLLGGIVGSRRNLCLPACVGLLWPREDRGAMLGRIIGLVLVTLAIAATASAQERFKPGATFRDCAECPEMVVISAGSFTMGSPASEPRRDSDEGPPHRVTIPRAFALGKYEVTFPEWAACVRAGGCSHRPKDEGCRPRSLC